MVAEGPRLVAAVLRPVHRDALGGHRAVAVPRASARCCSPLGAYLSWTQFAHVQDRVDDLAQPVGRPERARASRSSRRLRPRVGRRRRHRARPRRPDADPRGRDRLHLRRHRRGARPARRRGHPRRLPADRRRRAAHRAAHRATVREAAGHRPHHAHRRAGVHHHRRASPASCRSPGVTLPFVSYGGSSLVANYVLLALLMRISDEHAQRIGEVKPRSGRRGSNQRRRRMNKQIRRLGVGLLACSCAALRAAQLLQVVRADPYNDNPLQHAASRARLQPAARRDPSPPTASCSPSRCRRTTATSSSASTRRRTCSPTSPGSSLHASAATGVERTYNDELAGPHRPAVASSAGRPLRRPDHHAATSR